MIQQFGWVYLTALASSLTGMTLIDYRFKLCLFADAKSWVKYLLISLGIFVVIDYLAIATGLFLAGDSEYESGIFLPGKMPIEEPLFLLLMSYLAAQLVVAFSRNSGRKK